jgi:hypothetical protein
MWKRYRFKTHSTEDYRPIIFNPHYPWWCSGYGKDYAVIIAYLPSSEDLLKYWDDAFDIDFTKEESIEFPDRFPKPDYFKDSSIPTASTEVKHHKNCPKIQEEKTAEEILKKYLYLVNTAIAVASGSKPQWRVTEENALKAMREFAQQEVEKERNKIFESLQERQFIKFLRKNYDK